VGISTDKACKPINVMGMTKALQERIFIEANMDCHQTRFACVRYGNVIASRGSVVPLFLDQIASGGPVTITVPEMTRFLLSLHDAADTVFAAISSARPGETYIPRVPSSKIMDIAKILIGDSRIEIAVTGIRPGEKIHEILISEEEVYRTTDRGKWYAILPMLPEVCSDWKGDGCLNKEYSSMDNIMSPDETRRLLKERRLMPEDVDSPESELLR